MKPKVAFICVHNSCRSQMAEALGKHLAGDVFESFSAGTVKVEHINPDAIRIMKKLYGIDMASQYSKFLNEIPTPDIAISMGCDAACPAGLKDFDDNWNLDDPTGLSDEVFAETARKIEKNILALKQKIKEA